MSEIGSGVSNVDWNLKPNKPQSLNLSLPTPEIKLFSRESLEEEKAQISREKLTQPKEQNDTRTGICSAGFPPSGVEFGQPAIQISPSEAGKIIKDSCKGEINNVKNSAQQFLYDTVGETTTNVTAGIIAVAATGKFGGKTDIAGTEVSAQVNLKDNSSNVGISKRSGDTYYSANVRNQNGSTSTNLEMNTEVKGFNLRVGASQESHNKSFSISIGKQF